MVIKASSARQIAVLLADLASSSAVAREAAVARLTVLGARATERLVALAGSDLPPQARVAALRTLEGIGDPHGLDVALRQLEAPEAAVASAAASLARVFLRGRRGAEVVDRLTRTVLDPTRPDEVRVAALGALEDLKPATIAPLLRALGDDASQVLRTEARRAQASPGRPPKDPGGELVQAADRGLPDDPAGLAAALAQAGGAASPAVLLRIVERIRDLATGTAAARSAEWTRVRGMAHVVLASRRSRIAMYDLRESLEHASAALPVEFLTALSKIGDASCLEALAAAYARASGDSESWWRQHLADAFRSIVKRERLTRRHAVMKKVEKRWPEILG